MYLLELEAEENIERARVITKTGKGTRNHPAASARPPAQQEWHTLDWSRTTRSRTSDVGK